MERDAIKLIQDTAVDASESRIPGDFGDRIIALPVDYALHDIERYMDGRARYRGALTTDSLDDFTGYIKQRSEPDGTSVPGFVNAEKLAATVYFNLGNSAAPGHADDLATLALKPSAPYAGMQAVNGRPMLQKDAIDWLEDWAEHVRFFVEDGVEVTPSTAITSLRKITITSKTEATSSQENFRATRSALEDVEARGAAHLPSELQFTCTPYTGLPARTFRLRLAVLTSGDKPQLVLRVRNLEAEKEAIAQDFKRALLSELEGVATLTIGTFTP
jgi:uncharacterized protein YfdQ (DUF2303 family)